MVNHTFLATQLRTAQAAISRALQAVEADQVGADPPHVPTREDLRAALAADGLAELHGTHRPGDHADAAPPRSCQCNDPTVICPVHPRGPTAAECIRRGLDALAAEPDATTARKEITNVGSFDVPVVPAEGGPDKERKWLEARILDSAVAQLSDLQGRFAGVADKLAALASRAMRVELILLDLDRAACDKHGLRPF